MWPNRKILDLIGIELPIIQAPMAGANDAAMVSAVSEAGGLGSLPCAMLDAATIREQVATIRRATSNPVNLNFFCHRSAQPDDKRNAAWRTRLGPYYRELGLQPDSEVSGLQRLPFDEAMCELVEQLKPAVVSFHFGLPAQQLVTRVKQAGSSVWSSATTVAEARWLEDSGCDAVIAQGLEAGGHRGMFLTDSVATQIGTMALVPQIADAVKVPVVAAGGIADGRGIAAAFALGAAAVQIGSAYLFASEATISPVYRKELHSVTDDRTALTNVFTGRPARGFVNRVVREMGPITQDVPAFPGAASFLKPLQQKAESTGSSEFSPIWAGQAAGLGRPMDAGALTRWLAEDAAKHLRSIGAET